jgi:hypothetical protein
MKDGSGKTTDITGVHHHQDCLEDQKEKRGNGDSSREGESHGNDATMSETTALPIGFSHHQAVLSSSLPVREDEGKI